MFKTGIIVILSRRITIILKIKYICIMRFFQVLGHLIFFFAKKRLLLANNACTICELLMLIK